jgi:hypothetical protein
MLRAVAVCIGILSRVAAPSHRTRDWGIPAVQPSVRRRTLAFSVRVANPA